jgi:NAD(P)-dependent dehydrogenase (short-subunit alcohol dehydrogenase family)
MNIKDKVILVTGANRGMGKGYVEELLKAGAKKIYLGVRNPEAAKAVAVKNSNKLHVLKLDVTNPGAIYKKNPKDAERKMQGEYKEMLKAA